MVVVFKYGSCLSQIVDVDASSQDSAICFSMEDMARVAVAIVCTGILNAPEQFMWKMKYRREAV